MNAWNLLWDLIVGGVIFWVLWWGLGKIDPVEPFKKLGTVVLVVLSIFFIIAIFTGAIVFPMPFFK